MAFASTTAVGRRFTLAQFARRVKVSEGHARAMYAQKRLPRPTGFDVDERPWWSADAIDAWCAEVGRPVPEDATQIYRWPAATEPAPVTFSEDVVVPGGWSAETTAHVTVYDTLSGHLVWVQPYADAGPYDSPHYRHLAWVAALVLEPAMWTRAIVAVAETLMRTDEDYQPDCHAFILSPAHLDRSPAWLPEFLRSRLDDRPEPNTPRNVAVEDAGRPAVSRVAHVIGRDLPLWWDGSCTPTAIRAAEAMGITVGPAYVDRSEERRRDARAMLDRLQASENTDAAAVLAERRQTRRAQLPKPRTATITVPDVVTGWPEWCRILTAVHAFGLGEQFPQAWRLLASAALTHFNKAREDLTHLLLCGDGWYAPARIALPEWPLPVETAVRRAAATPFDPAAGATELPALRQAEAGLPWDDTVAEGMSTAADLLAGAVRKEHPAVVWAGVTGVAYLRRGRPVVEQYCDTLTPLPDPIQEQLRTRPTRRVMRLVQSERHMGAIRHYDLVAQALNRIEAFYTDPAGRLAAAELPAPDVEGPGRVIVEWPLYPIDGWTDETMIASDGDDFGVFALTPTNTGGLRVDPLPAIAEPRGGHFTWGYHGSGPTALYNALCRSAIADLWHIAPQEWLDMGSARSRSELWHIITTTDQDGPLRLIWPQAVDWATTDYQARR